MKPRPLISKCDIQILQATEIIRDTRASLAMEGLLDKTTNEKPNP